MKVFSRQHQLAPEKGGGGGGGGDNSERVRQRQSRDEERKIEKNFRLDAHVTVLT